MSYDLYLKPSSGQFGSEQFEQYFAGRPHYTITDGQAWYANEDTGVYFAFELQNAAGEVFDGMVDDTSPDEIEEDETLDYPVLFNVNYLRPHYFILEAEPEVTELVRTFDLVVYDPQIDGMGTGVYDVEKLINGWNKGNEFACARLPENIDEYIARSLPAVELNRIWRWNHARGRVQDEFGDSVFVPKIMFAQFDGKVTTFAAWTDAIPMVVPDVDYFFVWRQELAPSRLFGKKPDHALISATQLAPYVERYGAVSDAGLTVLSYDVPPDDVVRFVRELSPNKRKFEGLSVDFVLDRELLTA